MTVPRRRPSPATGSATVFFVARVIARGPENARPNLRRVERTSGDDDGANSHSRRARRESATQVGPVCATPPHRSGQRVPNRPGLATRRRKPPSEARRTARHGPHAPGQAFRLGGLLFLRSSFLAYTGATQECVCCLRSIPEQTFGETAWARMNTTACVVRPCKGWWASDPRSSPYQRSRNGTAHRALAGTVRQPNGGGSSVEQLAIPAPRSWARVDHVVDLSL